MEYVDGTDLDQFLVDQSLSLDQAAHLAKGILKGVNAAHQLGLIHRDLKPANSLLAVVDRKMIPKITDFGLAKLLGDGGSGSGRTRSGMAMGTPSYMPPEQIRSAKDVDARADVFALGAILYELVTGQRAYDGDDVLQIFNDVAGGNRIPARELRPDLPLRMQRAIDGALRVDPDERIPDSDTLYRVWTGEQIGIEKASGPFGTEVFNRVRQLGAGTVQPPVIGAVTSQPTMDPAAASAAVDAPQEEPPEETNPRGIAVSDGSAGTGRWGVVVGALLLLFFGTAGGLLLGGGVVAGLSQIFGGPTEITVEPPTPTPKPEPDPVEPAVPVAPIPIPPDLVPDVEPDVQPVRPTPAPSKKTGTFKVEGGVQAWIVVDKKRYFSGTPVPVGVHTYKARFPSGDVITRTVRIRAGKRSTISCNVEFFKCDA
jgi:serine/threonine-protein kinase